MKNLLLSARLDISESIQSRWFFVYSLIFIGSIILLIAFGLTESRVMGIMGLSRLMLVYIQLVMALLPVFVLISTVRSVAGDKEAGVFEYLLSMPIELMAWFWGKMLGRFVVVFVPVIFAMLLVIIWGLIKNLPTDWGLFFYYCVMVLAFCWCFLGLGMLISTISRSVDVAQGTAFFIWLLLLLLLDMILLGLMIQFNASVNLVVGIAVFNPLQVFRIASLLLFDPQLTLLGPAAFVILDVFGKNLFLLWAVIYPLLLGSFLGATGYYFFKKSDLP